jgi:hypothetical protein
MLLMPRRFRWSTGVAAAAAAALAMVGLTACFGSSAAPHRPTTPATPHRGSSRPILSGQLDPLTGEAEPDHGPLVAVMVENSEYARPQYGLASADVVYEAYTENFYYSRYLLLFYGHAPDTVGPVRSARPYFASWVKEWNAAYARAGGSALADQDIQQWGIHDMDWITVDQNLYTRSNSLPAPHNLFTSVPALMQYAKAHWGNPPVSPHWPFVAHVAPGTPPYRTITLLWNAQNTIEQWRWDQNAQGWTRWVRCPECQDSQYTQVMGRNTGRPVVASNVVIQYTKEWLDTSDPNKADLWVLMDTTGSGKALLFLGHRYYVGTWRRANLDAPTQFYLANGQLARFQPGPTWIEVVPESPSPAPFRLTLSS